MKTIGTEEQKAAFRERICTILEEGYGFDRKRREAAIELLRTWAESGKIENPDNEGDALKWMYEAYKCVSDPENSNYCPVKIELDECPTRKEKRLAKLYNDSIDFNYPERKGLMHYMFGPGD